MNKKFALLGVIAAAAVGSFGISRYSAARQESENRSSLALQREAARKIAQSSGSRPSGLPTGMPGGMPAGGPIQMMAKELALSPDQQKRIEDLFKSMPRGGEQGAGIDAMRSKMEAILTPAQLEKLSKFGGRPLGGAPMGGQAQ